MTCYTPAHDLNLVPRVFLVSLLRERENLGTSTGRRENLGTRLARLQVVYVVLSVKNAGLSDCTSSDSCN